MKSLFKYFWYPWYLAWSVFMSTLIIIISFLDQRMFPIWTICMFAGVLMLYLSHCYDEYKKKMQDIKSEEMRQQKIAETEEEIRLNRIEYEKEDRERQKKREESDMFMAAFKKFPGWEHHVDKSVKH